jgi:hypothetical protein
MDVSDASYYIFKEKGNKGSQMGHIKKIFEKKKKIPNQTNPNLFVPQQKVTWLLCLCVA